MGEAAHLVAQTMGELLITLGHDVLPGDPVDLHALNRIQFIDDLLFILCQSLCQRHRRIEPNLPDQGIGAVHGLNLGERAVLSHDCHGAEIDDFRDRTGLGIHPRPLFRRGVAVGEIHLGIAAE